MLFHVGMVRTGSTFLQYEVFPKLDYEIISNECLTGDYINVRDCKYISDAMLCYLKYNLLDDKKLFVSREYDTWKKSCYNKYVSLNGFRSFDSWDKNIFMTSRDDLDRIVAEFHNVKNCLCLKYEHLRDNPIGFVNAICDFIEVNPVKFLNIKHNKSRSPARAFVKRVYNLVGQLL